ncbi:acyl carrier protein [Streptococcus macacae]|uniref:Acyl carrier protein n=1 Tax=Streptococcus macacae NCTC 11558 TaxID=764298 RepID=G5JUF3_9STRE|nr:acyl carrier protein [Streptococcus macacae]EHJ51798.1 putative acyl carrier protein [Streptococcus macacae NCTC 11558]SUN78595.1 Acyl carrier protein [Streptococcus macacae NCTC 11558]
MENKEKVREIVEEIVEMEDFADDAKFIELFEFDSMLILELVSQLERTFNIVIPEEEYPNLQSLNDIYRVIDQQLSA